ncbi:MAG: hypothetical protein KDC67_15480 [Ignavibacteriae bacterium]|nr:hypothetical protein [Ignavibacteriota bacterium]
MKALLIVFLLQIPVFSWAVTIISDLDDTLKITNVLDRDEAIRNALYSKKAFSGFPDLLFEMQTYASDLYILSGSPSFLRRRVNSFLSHHK